MIADLLVGQNFVRAVNAFRYRFDLLHQAQTVLIERRKLADAAVGDLGHTRGKLLRTCRPVGPVLGKDRFGPLGFDERLYRSHFGIRIGDEMVDRDDHGNAERLHVLDVAPKVGAAFFDGADVLFPQIGLCDAAVHLHGPHGCNQNDAIGRQTRLAALDVHELFGTQIGAEASFGHNVIRQFQRSLGRRYRVTAVGDVRKRSAMDKGRVVFERLHKIGLHRVFQEHRHRPVGFDVTRIDGGAVAAIGDDHVAKAFLQISEVLGQAQNRHDLGRHRDVKTGLARETVCHTAQRCHRIAQRPVVHVQHALPRHAALINLKAVAPVDVVVDHRRKQVVCRRDRVKIACEVEVHILHRHHLRVSATSGPTLHPEVGPERRFANTNAGLLANRVQAIAKTNRRGCLALTCGCRVDRGHKDQLAVFLVGERVDERLSYLGLVVPVGQQMLRRDPQLLTDLLDRFFVSLAGNLDVGFIGHGRRSLPGKLLAGMRRSTAPSFSGIRRPHNSENDRRRAKTDASGGFGFR